MKTNATPKSVIKAVETVSNEKFDGNVVFMNYPKKITKYVARFTLRTKDVNGPGSMITKAGQRQPKANWEVQNAVMEEILRLNPHPNIYVDTIYGRKFSTGNSTPSEILDEHESEIDLVEVEEDVKPARRKSNLIAEKEPLTRKASATDGRKKPKVVNGKGKLMKALKYLLQHPELLEGVPQNLK